MVAYTQDDNVDNNVYHDANKLKCGRRVSLLYRGTHIVHKYVYITYCCVVHATDVHNVYYVCEGVSSMCFRLAVLFLVSFHAHIQFRFICVLFW